MITAVKKYLLELQDSICQALTEIDGQEQFQNDHWNHADGGGGRTRVISNGAVFEKGAVNFSHIKGSKLPPAATIRRPELAGAGFQALGVSLVIHPLNPHIPTVHMNIRFFISETESPIWWFGGGFDLTPYYGYVDDCVHWHQQAKKACDPFENDLYLKLKQACDEYFFLAHRQEPRGIGGLFFDDVNSWGFEKCFKFMQSVGDNFLPAYLPIVQRRKNIVFTAEQREFQCYRRGRYVEFNLLYDRGTLFGLQSRGRVESILVSLPPEVSWQYQYTTKPGSLEDRFYQDFLAPRNWLDLCMPSNTPATITKLASTSTR